MDRDVQDKSLEKVRTFLGRLARGRFPDRLRGKLDPSDIVQQTLMEAHVRRAQFRGETEAEQAAWLRLMLLHNLADAGRAFRQARRDLDRERPLAGPCCSSSGDPGPALVAEQSSPSQRAQHEELAGRLAEVLAGLPKTQRQAVVLHYWHGATLAEIAQAMQRSPAAVAGLLKRGLKQLRRELGASSG
jgi:RNA polymerase sigma-70 factor (ECF subfamily)